MKKLLLILTALLAVPMAYSADEDDAVVRWN